MYHYFFCSTEKTVYEMHISDWSSVGCSSALVRPVRRLSSPEGREGRGQTDEGASHDERSRQLRAPSRLISYRPRADRTPALRLPPLQDELDPEIGRASCRERVCQYG